MVEKVFFLSLKNFQNLLTNLKKKRVLLHLSSQYYYANYFYYIKQKLIKNEVINKIEINWSDALNEKRSGQLKTHDLKVNFLEDIFYHLNSIFYIFLGNGIIDINEDIKKFTEFSLAKFSYNDSTIKIKFTRSSKKRKRQLTIFFNKNNKININFANDEKIIVKYNNKKIQIPSFVCQKTLKFQILSFLRSSFSNSEISLNNLSNLKNLFSSLNKLRKHTNKIK